MIDELRDDHFLRLVASTATPMIAATMTTKQTRPATRSTAAGSRIVMMVRPTDRPSEVVVNLPPVPNTYDDHDKFAVVNLIDDSVVADANTVDAVLVP